MLGIELNDGYINVGIRRGKRLTGFTRLDAPLADGRILDGDMFRRVLARYVSENRAGKAAMLTVKTSESIARLHRLTGLHADGLKAVTRFHRNKELALRAAAEVFPVDIAGYEVGWRSLGGEDVLLCCIPKPVSEGISEVVAGAGLKPVCLDIYVNSVSLALERNGGNSACAVSADGGIQLIYIEDGVLKGIIPLAGAPELETVLAGVVLDYGYNLTGDAAFSAGGILESVRTDKLAVMGLLGVSEMGL